MLRLANAVNERSLIASAESENKGFSLEALGNLSKTKTNSGETAEQYLVSRLYVHLPESLDLASDMPGIGNGKDVNVPRIRSEVTKLKNSVQSMRALLELEEGDSDTPTCCAITDLGKETMRQLLSEAEKHTSQAEQALKECEEDFEQLCMYVNRSGH